MTGVDTRTSHRSSRRGTSSTNRPIYLVFHPAHKGLIWGLVDRDGTARFPSDPWFPDGENIVLSNIIKSMKRGVYTEKGHKLLCVPDIRNKYGSLIAKKKDSTTLGKLFAPKKARGIQTGLKSISEKNRYRGKVDWESKRGQIAAWLGEGISRGKIARRLKVSPSTLSEANKRFGLYPPKPPVA